MSEVERRREVELLAYVVDALRLQERRYRQSCWSVPAGVSELVDEIGFRVSRGQRGSSDAETLPTAQSVPEPRLLVRYEEAARRLDVSLSTLKRLIRAGDLTPVRLAGASRLRATDLEALVDSLAGDDGGSAR